MKFIQIPRRLRWPFWDLWFYLKFYLDSVTQVRDGHDQKCQVLSERAQKIQRKICTILAILAIRCLQLTILSLVELSAFTRILNHDYVIFYDCPKEINLCPMTFGLQTACFIYRMYWFDFHRAFEPILIVQLVLFRSWNGCFLERRVKHGQRRVAISQLVHSYTASYLNCLKYFCATALVVIIVYSSFWVRNIFEYWTYLLLNFSKGPLCLVYTLTVTLFANILNIAFALVNIILSTIILTFTLCMFIRLKQANKLLQNSKLSPYRFGKFCSFHTETLLKIISVNRYFGQMLLDFIFIYMPINAFALTQIILGRFGLMASFICINMLAFQYVVMFGFHLLAAMYSARIHKCSYWLLGWSARAQFGSAFAAKLQLTQYIFAFNTEKRYGITYGNIGLVSFESFTKVIAMRESFHIAL